MGASAHLRVLARVRARERAHVSRARALPTCVDAHVHSAYPEPYTLDSELYVRMCLRAHTVEGLGFRVEVLRGGPARPNGLGVRV